MLDVDMRQLTCCGRMDAAGTPGVDGERVATYFEGNFINNQHYTFGSQPADSETPISHSEQRQWKSVQNFMQHVYPTLKADTHTTTIPSSGSHSTMQCDGGSIDPETSHHTSSSRPQWPSLPPCSMSSLLLAPPTPSPVTRLLHTSRYLFMRWKEMYFLCGADGRLSIGGVYLLALDRLTGEISGVYWDEQSRRATKKRCQQLRLQRVPDAMRDGRVSTHALH